MANLSTTQHDAVNRAETTIKSGASQFMPNAQLILFGSRARGDAHKRSDFDLAFKPKSGFTDKQYLEFEEYLEQSPDLIYPVDLVDLRTAPQVLLDRIESEGILWKE
jgi:predicted nucleotidyltransferase